MATQILLLCPHCSNTTQHDLLFRSLAPFRAYDMDDNFLDGIVDEVHELLQCTTCRCVSYYTCLDTGEERALTWPRSEKLDESVPNAVAQNYAEAKKIQNLSPNGFAVMLRRALEALCHDRGLPAGPLHAGLKKLADTGEIPAKLSDVTSVIRQLGNAGAHHSLEMLTVPMTWVLDDFFRAVVEYVYVAPKKLSDFQSTMKRLIPPPEA